MADEVHEEPPIDIEQLVGWDAPSPQSGFSDRVAAAWSDERRSIARASSSRKRTIVAVAAALLLVVGVAIGWSATRGETARGHMRAEARESIEIGERAVAVAERGAELRWRVADDGRTHVEQSLGEVFYRVERGLSFTVTTPYGSVRVTGTCFTVQLEEAEEMDRKSAMKAGAVGAVLATGIVVTVYEGGVVLARDGKEVALRAGERGRADAQGPRRSSFDGDGEIAIAPVIESDDQGGLAARVRSQARELERLRTAGIDQRAEIARLEAQVLALGGGPSASEPRLAKVRRCAEGDREAVGCSFVDPDRETLGEMARCGIVKADVPHFLYDDEESAAMPADWTKRAGLEPGEAEAFADLGEKFRDAHTEALATIYAEAGGDPDVADGMPSRSLEAMIVPMIDTADLERAREHLSRERAGLVDPLDPSVMSLADRYVRQVIDVGNRFESQLAETLGADRARALRLTDNGWPGGSIVWGDGCEP